MTDWTPTWTQAVSDFRGEDDEEPFDDATVRMTLPASIGGTAVRIELSNRFGDDPVVIDTAAIGVGARSVPLTFAGDSSTRIPAGESIWSDPAELAVRHGDALTVDLHLPEPTPYATAGGFLFQRSAPGSGAVPEAPSAESDGTGWSLPAGGPFLRTIEVAGNEAAAVVVCLGSSSTAMGWPQLAAALLPADARVAVLNRGIAGNRIRADAPAATPSFGRAGLVRFDDDVLGTTGATHVVIAYNSNDFGLPGLITPVEELPSIGELIDAYRLLVDRSRTAGLTVVLATISALSPELGTHADREGIRVALNDWIRTSGPPVADFDAAIRSETEPSRLDPRYAAPDDTHPNIDGERRLAAVFVDVQVPLLG